MEEACVLCEQLCSALLDASNFKPEILYEESVLSCPWK